MDGLDPGVTGRGPKNKRPRRNRYLPILIPILDGFDMIGVGVTKGYELVNTGEIDTVLIGRRRYATRESLERLATPAPLSAVTQNPSPLKSNRHRDPGS